MSLWSKLTGDKAKGFVLPEPWGLYLGATAQIDTLPFRLHPEMMVCLPENEQDGMLALVAQGLIDLGDKSVCRMYSENDTMLQFMMSGQHVEEATLYVAHDAFYPDSQLRLNEWVGTSGRIGALTYSLGDTVYQRMWDDPQATQVSPVRYVEKVYTNRQATLEDRSIQQTAMLYARPLNKEQTIGEYLLLTHEEHSDGTQLVSVMLGIDIDTSLVRVR